MKKLFVLLFVVLLLFSGAVFAHEGEDDGHEETVCTVEGGASSCSYSGEEVIEGQDHLEILDYTIDFQQPDDLSVDTEQVLAIVVRGPDGSPAEGLAIQGQIVDPASQKDLFYAEVYEEALGTYAFRWKPSFAGQYYVQYIFRSPDDAIVKPTYAVTITDPRAQYAWYGGLVVGALSLLIGVYAARPKKKKQTFNIKIALVGLGIGLLSVWLGYSVSAFYNIGGERGFVVCGPDGCDLALHVHSQLHMHVCGQDYHLPLETGDLNKQHTHKELDLLHYHALIKTDETGTTLLEPEKLMVGDLFDQMNIPFTAECFTDYCNGDVCPDGTVGHLRMTVNDVENTEFNQYVWKDGDVITITFG